MGKCAKNFNFPRTRTGLALTFLTLAFFFPTLAAHAADTPEMHLSIRNNHFEPNELTVPAGQKIKLIVKNEDPTAAEFESYELNREKIVPANSDVIVYLDPLDPGSYPFFDDFHRDTTTGKIISK